MSLEFVGKQLALEQLDRSVAEIELVAERKQSSLFMICDIVNVARLLQADVLATRALRVLHSASPPEFFVNRATLSGEELDLQHPIYEESKILTMMQNCARQEPHIRLALDGRYLKALDDTTSATEVEEIAETLAVLGDFDAALESCHAIAAPRYKQWGVSAKSREQLAFIVIGIECFRRCQIEETHKVLADLELRKVDAWNRVILAVGLIGREPWLGYPYPDY